MDEERVEALMRELVEGSEEERLRILAALRDETQLDWGTDVEDWKLWWRVQREGVPPVGLRPLSPQAEAVYQALLEMGLQPDREHVRANPDIASYVAGARTNLWLPDDLSYYLVGAFPERLRAFLGDLDIPIDVDRAAQPVVIVLGAARTSIPDRPRTHVFAAVSELLSRVTPDVKLWMDDRSRAWRLSDAHAAAWAGHGIVLSAAPGPESVTTPLPAIADVIPGLAYTMFDGEMRDLEEYEEVATELLALAGIAAHCTIEDERDELVLVLEVDGRKLVSRSLPDSDWFDTTAVLECLNAVMTARRSPRFFIEVRDGQGGREVGIALVTKAEYAQLDAAGLVPQRKTTF
jgi:hypothetical protein